MPWVKFDDSAPEHRKIKSLHDSAYRLHDEAIKWCARHLTDGFVPAAELRDVTNVARPMRWVPDLVSRRLWEPVNGGWRIHDYLEYQPSGDAVRAEREARRRRQEKWREKKRGRRVSDASHDSVTDASGDAAPYPLPTRPEGEGRGGSATHGPESAAHPYVSDSTGSCLDCRLPEGNRIHRQLRIVGGEPA